MNITTQIALPKRTYIETDLLCSWEVGCTVPGFVFLCNLNSCSQLTKKIIIQQI